MAGRAPARAASAALLASAALVLAGCGGSSGVQEATLETRIATIDAEAA